ncbi:MAG: hypothetical protein JO240_09425 [Solirubrobacterales bacterium]|nr:hypothetical protein [Solirubrobacterales bacterium]
MISRTWLAACMGVVAGVLAVVLAAISAPGGSSPPPAATTPRCVTAPAPAAEAPTATTAAQTPATGAPLTLSGRQKAPILGGTIVLNANQEGSGSGATISDPNGGPGFTITHSAINQATVGAYPSLFVGQHGNLVTRHDPFPLQLSAIRPGQVITSVHSVTPRSACSARWVDFYDIFLTAGAHANQFSSTREELEIWQNAGNRAPGGTPVARGVRLDGRLYDVYNHVTDANTIAYVPRRFASGSFHGDLRPFIQDSIRRGYAQPNWYLTDVEHGFEINSGNVVGLGDANFSVQVGGNSSSP